MAKEAKATISKAEALARYTRACAARESKGRFERDGNWVDISFALRHKDCEAAEVTVVEHDGSTILKIQPATLDLLPGKSRGARPAFHLIVT